MPPITPTIRSPRRHGATDVALNSVERAICAWRLMRALRARGLRAVGLPCFIDGYFNVCSDRACCVRDMDDLGYFDIPPRYREMDDVRLASWFFLATVNF
ncbi:hypothetical protein AVEN_264065-1 [Araneus ventricosus]|uniref:Uncharacterized protein n=1 Tax=Araneus ventricosus TaxID=182803 RepID=A0A4Y2A3H8_ARAVE|nr:hypothetical protein AVEN_264065-1 [Araneus ventricosus]